MLSKHTAISLILLLASLGSVLASVLPFPGVFLDGTGNDVKAAAKDVRNGGTQIKWAVFTYSGKLIFHLASGNNYDDMLDTMQGDNIVYAYVRLETEDGIFYGLLSWIGRFVSPLKIFKSRTDVYVVKDLVKKYDWEILTRNDKSILQYDAVLRTLKRAKTFFG